MIFGSVCSGIEAASCAWHPLGWQTAFVAEIEPFPCSVLAHHYPTVPNYGDMTKFKDWPDATINVLVGGTPCQSFSVAGLRKGLDDPRGNLTLTYLAVAAKYRPTWLVWENVPGVLSDATGAFGAFLGGLAELGYGFAYRILDAQYFGVPQRRRRVFVVGCLGDWRRAAAVLLELHSLQGHPAPRREAGQKPAPTISARTKGGGGLGTDFDCDGGLIPATVGALTDGAHMGGGSTARTPIADVSSLSRCLNAGGMGRQDYETETLIPTIGGGFDVAPCLTQNYGKQPDNSDTNAGPMLLPVAFDTTQMTSVANRSNPKAGDPCHPLAAGAHAPAIAFSAKDYGADAGELSPTLRAGGHTSSHANAGVMPAIAFVHQAGGTQTTLGYDAESDTTPTLPKCQTISVHTAMQVRRLTPRECERLQGFPDDYTLVQHRNKPAADGPRYKALGNSMAVPVMAWIGQRIAMVEELCPV